MAQSKLICDLVDGKTTLEHVFERLILIATELGEEKIADWATLEKDGYPEGTEVPSYRICKLAVFGEVQYYNGFKVVTDHHFPLSTDGCPQEMVDYIEKHQLKSDIKTLESMVLGAKNGNPFAIPMTAATFSLFTKGIHNISVLRVTLEFTEPVLNVIIGRIRTKLIKLLAMYENRLGCLDSYDVRKISKKESQQIYNNGLLIIQGDDGAANVFENSKVKKSNVGRGNRISKITNKDTDIQLKTDVTVTNQVPEKKTCWVVKTFKWLWRVIATPFRRKK